MNPEILHQDIQTLLEFFSKNSYRVSTPAEIVSYFDNCDVLNDNQE